MVRFFASIISGALYVATWASGLMFIFFAVSSMGVSEDGFLNISEATMRTEMSAYYTSLNPVLEHIPAFFTDMSWKHLAIWAAVWIIFGEGNTRFKKVIPKPVNIEKMLDAIVKQQLKHQLGTDIPGSVPLAKVVEDVAGRVDVSSRQLRALHQRLLDVDQALRAITSTPEVLTLARTIANKITELNEQMDVITEDGNLNASVGDVEETFAKLEQYIADLPSLHSRVESARADLPGLERKIQAATEAHGDVPDIIERVKIAQASVDRLVELSNLLQYPLGENDDDIEDIVSNLHSTLDDDVYSASQVAQEVHALTKLEDVIKRLNELFEEFTPEKIAARVRTAQDNVEKLKRMSDQIEYPLGESESYLEDLVGSMESDLDEIDPSDIRASVATLARVENKVARLREQLSAAVA